MKSMLIVLCSLLSGALSGKTNEHQDTKPDTSDYLDYYRAVAAAEEAAVNADYQRAIVQYRKVFGEYRYNNPVDCYIAA